MEQNIIIKGAKENNLKDINLEIPRNKFVIITGVSGSGKTTLAFDTIFAEGQRRYVESLSTYARQFLGGVEKPNVDSIEGLSPSISIDQKTTSHNPRSTVGTTTEIYDFLRLLYARVGEPFCPKHDIKIQAQSTKQMVNKVLEKKDGSKILILARIVENQKGTHLKAIEELIKKGYIRAKVNNKITLLEEIEQLEKNKKHTIDLVVDRIIKKHDSKNRLYDSISLALEMGKGEVIIESNGEKQLFSQNFSCPKCGFSVPKLEPRLFSFNSPIGACQDCKGLGIRQEVDIDYLIPDTNKSINKSGIYYFKNMIGSKNIEWQEFLVLCKSNNIDLNKKIKDFSKKEMKVILDGAFLPKKVTITTKNGNSLTKKGFLEGVKTKIERLYKNTTSQNMRDYYARYLSESVCPTCNGARLDKKVLAVRVNNLNIFKATSLSIKDLLNHIENLDLDKNQAKIAQLVVKEISDRLSFLNDVGLDYLSLSRKSSTLSGGESQRIRLATQIGSKLCGVLYVLDEPSIGLHQKDNQRLINSLKKMRNLGNSLLVVEHDEETMLQADYIVDVGPYAGKNGGKVVAVGPYSEVIKNPNSITAKFLNKEEIIKIPKKRRKGKKEYIEILGAKENNLKNLNLKIPLGNLCVVTGVSGSGKSSLINEILYKQAARIINKNIKIKPGKHKQINGLENIEKIINVSQEPIGRTPRSNPATYTGSFDHIRDLFANTNEAKARGYLKGRFSFNVKGGRCERCQGDGVIRVPMHFLPDVYITCEVCDGKRYSEDTLEITYKDKNIFDILEMTIEEAYSFFTNIPKINRKLKTLMDVGMGYVKVGQSALTLSGGEAQRVKLANELQKRSNGNSLYILDEPTTGLHAYDVRNLINVINTIVNNGDSVIIIEHNLDIIKVADHIIDLGPDGGDRGGNLVAKGTPEKVSNIEKSYTGQYLKKILKKG